MFNLMHRSPQRQPSNKRVCLSEHVQRLVREDGHTQTFCIMIFLLEKNSVDGLYLCVLCEGSEILVEKLSESQLKETELLESVKFSFNVESLGLTLYSNNPAQVCMRA